MLLADLAILFPKQIEEWPVLSPSKAIPLYLKTFVRNTWGKKFSANDFNKKYTPNRFGASTRNFQIGDQLKTLSRSHLLRQNSLVTKTDISPGRKNILILFHCYNNMTYTSSPQNGNKGQLSNAICAVLEEIHTSLAQNFIIKPLYGPYFLEECLRLQRYLQKYANSNDKIYILSDFLFNPENIEASAEEVLKTIHYFNLKQCTFFIIRDSLEYISQSQNRQSEVCELLPWDNSELQIKLYSDENYKSNLQKQISDIQEKMKQTMNSSCIVTQEQSIDEFLEFLANIC